MKGQVTALAAPPNSANPLYGFMHVAPRSFASKPPQNMGEGAFEAKERWPFVVLAFCSLRGAASGVTWPFITVPFQGQP